MNGTAFCTATLIAFLFLAAGCAHYETTLTDSQGRTVKCEADGKNGLITGHMLRNTFNQCVNNAKANGYTEGGRPASTVSTQAASPDLEARLRTLKDAYDQGLISQEEYDAKRKEILAEF